MKTLTAQEAPQTVEAPPHAWRLDVEELPGREQFLACRGLGAQTFTMQEIELLRANVPDEELEILPTGEVYLSQIGYRERLNNTFGPGAWGLFEMREPEQRGKVLAQQWALVIRGRVVAVATGEHDYNPERESKWQASYPTAIESAKSNALMRCCKDIGVAAQCWSRAFTNGWRDKYAVHVYRTDRSGEEHDEWRSLAAGPHWNETGLHPGSPNRAQWMQQIEEHGKAGRMAPTRSIAPEKPSTPAATSKTSSKPSASKPPGATVAAKPSKPITDAQYGLLKGALKNNGVEPANLFEWLKTIHKIEVPMREGTEIPDGRKIPQALFDKVLEFIRGGGTWDKPAQQAKLP